MTLPAKNTLGDVNILRDAYRTAIEAQRDQIAFLGTDWEPTLQYIHPCSTRGSDGILYDSLQSSLGQDPTTPSSAYWADHKNVPADTGVYDTIAQLRASGLNPTKEYATVLGYYAQGDGGGGPLRIWKHGEPAGTYVDDGGSIIVATGGDGSAAWLFVNDVTEIQSGWFGCDATGLTDTTASFQSFIAAAEGKIGVVDDGIYQIGPINIPNDTELTAINRGGATIKPIPTLADNQTLISNKTVSATPNDYSATGIVLKNLVFDGDNIGANRVTSLVAFTKTLNASMINCTLKDTPYIGLAIGASKDTMIQGCLFTGTGNPVVTAEGGASIWHGSSGDGTVTRGTKILNNTFKDTEWSGIYCAPATDTLIDGNLFSSTKESSIFSTGTGLTVTNNTFQATTKKNISASSIEVGSDFTLISNNVLRDADSDGISITDADTVSIIGNVILNCARDTVSFPTASGVSMISTEASPLQPRNITISGNRFSNTISPAYAFVSAGNAGAAVDFVVIDGNNASGNTFSSGRGIHFAASKMGTSVSYRNNLGCNGNDPFVTHAQTPLSPSNLVVTGTGFRPRAMRIEAAMVSSTQLVSCSSYTSAGGSEYGIYTSYGGAVGTSSIHNNAVRLVYPNGTNAKIGNLISFDQDGVTISFPTADSTVAWATITLYP